jgi:hypothetical protein
MENKKVKEFTLPYPPSLNRAYRAVSGRVILSAIARAYIDIIAGDFFIDCSGIRCDANASHLMIVYLWKYPHKPS